ncbi:MAG: GTPase Era [Christensenellaceae bacterium]|jgi:GTP-binding protein Era|nr:GTPase Era [Christensenellaceae bacterium]
MIVTYAKPTEKSQIQPALNALNEAFNFFNIKENEAFLELSVNSDEEIRLLNAETRNIDRVTDVLSFQNVPSIKLPLNLKDYEIYQKYPENGALMLGEIVICLTVAQAQAKEYGHSFEREVAFLAIHGLLHLLGYDHETEAEEKLMQTTAEAILERVNLTRSAIDSSEDDAEEVIEDAVFDSDEGLIKGVQDSNEKLISEFFSKPQTADSASKTVANASHNPNFKCGNVAIIGAANAGKSTLVNALIGEKVSIVTSKPQTTRNKILGILTRDDSQIILLDTPGLHAPKNILGKLMMRSVTASIEEADIVLYIIDAQKGLTVADVANIEKNAIKRGKTTVLAVNKVDSVKRERVAAIFTKLAAYNDTVAEIIPISAKNNKNLDVLLASLTTLLPLGEPRFDGDSYTDRTLKFLAQETIREKALKLLDDEIPFDIGVLIEKYEERPNGAIVIGAVIYCQKENHKGIIIGKNGAKLKTIGTYARQDIEKLNGDAPVHLTLFVKVRPDWRTNPSDIKDLGYAE